MSIKAQVLLVLAVAALPASARGEQGELRISIQGGGSCWWVASSRGNSRALALGWTAGGSVEYGVSDDWSLGLQGYYGGIPGDLGFGGVEVPGAQGVLFESVDHFVIGAISHITLFRSRLTPMIDLGLGLHSSHRTDVALYSRDRQSLLLSFRNRRLTSGYLSAGAGLEWRFLDHFLISAEAQCSVLVPDPVALLLNLSLAFGYYL